MRFGASYTLKWLKPNGLTLVTLPDMLAVLAQLKANAWRTKTLNSGFWYSYT